MVSVPQASATLPGYAAAREKLAHRLRPSGVLDVTGDDRVSFLQGQLTQEMRDLSPGECREAAGLTPKGKLLFVTRVLGGEDRVRLVVPGTLRAVVLDHLRKYAVFTKVSIEDRSEEVLRAALYGPEARALPTPDGFELLPAQGEIATEVLAPVASWSELEALLRSAESPEIPEDTAEVLRVEAGRPRFGRDMNSTNLPDEAGLAHAISVTKGCYVGQEVVARLRTYGRVNRRLVGFRFPDGPVAPGAVLKRPGEGDESHTPAGRVTSSVLSPRFGPIGLGYAFRDVPSGARLVSSLEPRLGAIVADLPLA